MESLSARRRDENCDLDPALLFIQLDSPRVVGVVVGNDRAGETGLDGDFGEGQLVRPGLGELHFEEVIGLTVGARGESRHRHHKPDLDPRSKASSHAETKIAKS